MSQNSKIEWTDHTFNPWIGCTKVSPACDHCYAERSTPSRTLKVVWGPHADRHRTSASNWTDPKRWNDRHEAFFAEHGRRQRVFCASLADVFDNAVDRQWRADLFDLILATPNLDWLLLTKRIGNVGRMLSDVAMSRGAMLTVNDEYRPLPNVWLGATIVNQEEADRDIPKLLAVPAAKRFLSMEPLLGPVVLDPRLITALSGCSQAGQRFIDWVIVGGESGPGARPMHPDWARSLRDQCQAAGVPFLFKQHGEWAPGSGDFGAGGFKTAAVARDGRVAEGGFAVGDYPKGAESSNGWAMVHRPGKKAAGRQLDGRLWDEVPA